VAKKTDKSESSDSLVLIPIKQLHELPGPNPNVLTVEQENELKASMRRFGFRQAITVVPRVEGGYWVSDGIHRVRTAAATGLEMVPALVAQGDERTVRAERLALNRIRGSVDLGAASTELRALMDTGWAESDLAACGFSPDELAVLLKASEQDSEAGIMEDGLEAGPLSENAADHAKRFSLTLTFDHKEERDGFRALLLAQGVSVEDGFRTLVKSAGAANG
jgi:ParB-like chromosome segregation protein Spo0J